MLPNTYVDKSYSWTELDKVAPLIGDMVSILFENYVVVRMVQRGN